MPFFPQLGNDMFFLVCVVPANDSTILPSSLPLRWLDDGTISWSSFSILRIWLSLCLPPDNISPLLVLVPALCWGRIGEGEHRGMMFSGRKLDYEMPPGAWKVDPCGRHLFAR